MDDGGVLRIPVAIDREIIPCRGNVRLWDAETLGGAGAFAFEAVAYVPARGDVGEVIFRVLGLRKQNSRTWA